jgi:hypothetical protein
MMKKVNILVLAVLTAGIVIACKKKTDDPPPAQAPPQVRDEITYWLTINPRAENKTNKDTLIIKLNGNPILTSKGSVADAYGPYQIKTYDKLSVYYNPGTIVTTKSVTICDENGLLLSLDYNGGDNSILKEYSCRCIANETITVQ